MKIKYRDLLLAIDYLNSIKPEVVEFDTNEVGGSAMSIEFGEALRLSKIFLFEAGRNTTPEVRTTNKLYKKD